METSFAIQDVFVVGLERRGGVMTVSHENDHLLRRFGQADVVAISPDAPQTIQRKKADELWTVLDGSAVFSLEDTRQESPNFGAAVTLTVSADEPLALLVPFGVHCRVTSRGPARLLRLTTHEDATDRGDLVPAP